MSEPTPMEVEQVAITDLVFDAKNARKGNVAAIIESLREFGQHRAVIVQRGTNRIIAGDHTVQAMQQLGWETVSVTFVDDDDETAIRRSLADNKVSDLAKWDDEQLKALLLELDDPASVPGFDQRQVNTLLAELQTRPTEPPMYPIVANPGEHYSYVMIVATNETDDAWLKTRFGLRREQSYKSNNVGLSRVLTVERAREVVPEL